MKGFVNLFKNLKFKHKLIFSYLVVTLIPILVLGIYFYIQSKTFLMQQTEMALNQNVKQIADNINYKFERYTSIVESLSYDPGLFQVFNTQYTDVYPLYNDLKDKVEPLFNNIMFLNKDVVKIFMFTENNAITKRVDSIGAVDDIKDEAWFIETKKDWRTNWYFKDGKLFGAHNLIKQATSDLTNMVYVELKYQNVFESIDEHLLNNQSILIYDSNNNVVLNKGKIPQDKPIWWGDAAMYKEPGLAKIGIEDYIVIKKEITSIAWTVYSYIPLNSVSIDARKIVLATAIVIGICLIVLVLIIWIFSTTFVRRINKLNNKMKLVAQGNLKVDISSNSRDEIGELINGFNFMLKNINSLIAEVYQGKVDQKEAELKALKAQINPHFLYNSLSLINWRAIKIKATDISHITTTLSKFYRTTLNKGDNIISLRDEIENTRAYTEIQLIRHDYNFDVIYDIQDEILKYQMINLILQPIVENAIEHGLDNKRDGRGILKILCYELDSVIELKVEDNGPGMDNELSEQILIKQSKGYGLRNVQERLKLFFGEDFGITIKSELGVGTCVTVRIPKFIK